MILHAHNRRSTWRRLGWCALALALAPPATADAHGLFLTPSFEIPTWLFTAAAGAVLVISFVLLGVLWKRPLLEQRAWRPWSQTAGRILTAAPTQILFGSAGVGLLLLVVVAGLAGSHESDDNFATVFVFTIFWVGLVPLSVVFGDVFRAFNPWRAIGRAVSWAAGRLAPVPEGAAGTAGATYPTWLGHYPAALGLLAFVLLELASDRSPRAVAIATVIYTLVTFAAMARYGVDAWSARGETFGVYFNLLSRIGPVEIRDRRLGLRKPLAALADLEVLPGMVILVCAMIGTASFDGFSATDPWQSVLRRAIDAGEGIGLSTPAAGRIATGLGVVALTGAVVAFYRLGAFGAARLAPNKSTRELTAAFSPSLVPIAFAYVLAHYSTFLLIAGQSIVSVASDPLGNGADIFGTAGWEPNARVLSAEAFWGIEVGVLLLGHVLALILAHDVALKIYGRAATALRSQRAMLVVMIGFTAFALWLLSQSSELA